MFTTPLSIALTVSGGVLFVIGVILTRWDWKHDPTPSSRKAAHRAMWAFGVMQAGVALFVIVVWTAPNVSPLTSGMFTATVAIVALGQLPKLYRTVRRAHQRNDPAHSTAPAADRETPT